MEIKTVTLVGLGAVGAPVASAINKAVGKENLFCLVDDERKHRYEKDGIFINEEKQDFNLVTPDKASVTDLVIIATKNLQLAQILGQLKNSVGPDTVILSLLNGIQSERDIAAVFGAEKVLYGYIVGINSIHVKNQITCPGCGTTVFGEKSNEKSQRVLAVSKLFEQAKMGYRIPENIELEMWKKFHMNVCFNTLSALLNATYGAFTLEPLKQLSRSVSQEIVAVANSEGIALTSQIVEDQLKFFEENEPWGKTSMHQDIEAGRKTENQWFCGTIEKLGAAHNIPTPYCSLLKQLITSKEAVNDYKI